MRYTGILLSTFLSVALASCGVNYNRDSSVTPLSEDAIAVRAKTLLNEMTLEEKIGQVIQADISAVTPDDVRTYNLGSVLNGGNSAPGGGKTAPAEDWIALADKFWLASTDTTDGGVGIPLMWGTDAVHGHNNLQSATIFPHNSALGATQDAELMRRIGDVTAREIRATGLDWTFAPTIAVARDDRWGRAYESYSENPGLVASYASAIIEGLQGKPGEADFLKGENVMATAKHFIGDGGTQFGIDKGDTTGDIETILELHGEGYRSAIRSEVQSVMASFSSVNGEKVHGSSYLLNDVLRDDLGFEGFVVGDWNGHAEIPGCTATDCPQALEAGLDMYMAPDSWKGIYESLLEHARNGTLDMARLDEAVLRILAVKIRSGLLDSPKPSLRKTSDVSVLGNPEHRAVAREAVRKSLVLLKNDGNLLPIKPGVTVLVTGSGADSMQQQTGGWTLNWQGTGNSNDEFETGETILSGLTEAVSRIGGEVVSSPDGSFGKKPDMAIVVFGEDPYAEYIGDRTDLVFEFADGANLALLKSFRSQGIPVVSVFLTGRPLWVNPHINQSDAFVVAWLPGTEGGGVADVLVGDAEGLPRYPFKGKLSFSWPDNGIAEPINDASHPHVLFPFGFGLTYDANPAPLSALSEDAGVSDTSKTFKGQVFSRGQPAASFTAYLGDTSNLSLPVTSNAMTSLGGTLAMSGIDYKAQEDARLLQWTGSGAGTFSLRSSRPLDLTRIAPAEQLFLQIDWMMQSDPSDELSISMSCGEGCEGDINISELAQSAVPGSWLSSRIPVSCFVAEGFDPTRMTSAFNLNSAGETAVAIHSVSIETSADTAVACP